MSKQNRHDVAIARYNESSTELKAALAKSQAVLYHAQRTMSKRKRKPFTLSQIVFRAIVYGCWATIGGVLLALIFTLIH